MLQPTIYVRLLLRIILVLYFLAAALFLGARYWVLPNIDHWRPQIAQQLSRAVGVHVTLGPITAGWSGLNPSLQINDIDFTDHSQRPVLHLPQLRAVLSWRSLFSPTLQFVLLEARGLTIRVRQDRYHKLRLLGQSFDLSQTAGTEGASRDIVPWLLRQRHIALSDAVIEWVDDTRSAPPLVLSQVNMVIQGGSNTPRLFLRAVPPSGLGKAFELRGQFQLDGQSAPTLHGVRGELYVHVDDMIPAGWSPWLDLPLGVESGRASAQWWLTIRDGQADAFTLTANVQRAKWRADSNIVVQAESASMYVSGRVADYERLYAAVTGKSPVQAAAAVQPLSLAAPVPTSPLLEGAQPSQGTSPPQPSLQAQAPPGGSTGTTSDVDVAIRAKGLEVGASDVFASTLGFDQIAVRAGISLYDGRDLRVSLARAHLVSPDMDVQLQGTWRQGGSGVAGVADITGRFKRASMAAIGKYMPSTVNQDAREWLAKGLVAGQIENADVVLKGDLEDFPWEKESADTDFLIAGDYVGGVIDYLPAEGARKAWPKLADMRGKVSLHRVDLRVVADEARVWPTTKAPIELRNLRAQIPNIDNGSVLTVQGNSTAGAQTYLALAGNSPLGKMLDGRLDEATAQGNWEVPLWLRVPLLHSDNTTVAGAVRFTGGTFRLMPGVPTLSAVNGSLLFSDVGVSVQSLRAKFLGGAVAFTGGVGGKGNGLHMHGDATAEALAQYVDLKGMKRLGGVLPYELTWQHTRHGGSVFTLDSTLKGLSLDLPVPWGKDAGQELPLRARWGQAGKNDHTTLSIEFGPEINAAFMHQPGSKKGPYFYAGSLAIDRKADLPISGMNIDAQFAFADMDAWEAVADDFSQTLSGKAFKPSRPLLPSLRQLRLQARQLRYKGMTLDSATLTAAQPAPDRWRVDIDSQQTVGTILWNEGIGKAPGNVDARFKRLALGSADKAVVNPDESKPDDTETLSDDALDMVPAVQLQVDKFSLYGRPFGSLTVRGVNQAGGKTWRLESFSLVSPTAKISGSGQWRLRGQNRGVTLDALAKISNLGRYMNQLGFADMVENGNGTVKGQFTWRNMPWRFDIADLSGKIETRMQAGRFVTVNSNSARLLELLSLQSIQRIATLSINPASLFRDGFPFDNLSGSLRIGNGMMNVDKYRVEGPAANISLGGDVDLTAETLNLQASVAPNLDMSGATVAAGIALNPIIGLGAFVTQWLLRNPLSEAMTVHYHVSGGWEDPKLDELTDAQWAKLAAGRKAAAGKNAAAPVAADKNAAAPVISGKNATVAVP